jgi:hypothetical protein
VLLIYCATPARLADKKKEIMDFVTKQGFGPFHPFQAFEYERFEGGPVGREKTIEFCCRAIDICDEFWLFGISEGTLTELCHALKRKKPMRLVLDEFDKNWQKEYRRLKNKFNDPLNKIKSDM